MIRTTLTAALAILFAGALLAACQNENSGSPSGSSHSSSSSSSSNSAPSNSP